NRRQAVLEHAEVKSGAAYENGEAAGICPGGDLLEREGAPPRGRAALGGIEKAVEPVRHLPLDRLLGTRRQYAEIAIALEAVGIDDDASQHVRQLQCQRRLSARRRTGDDENRRSTATPLANRLVTERIGGVGRGLMSMVL